MDVSNAFFLDWYPCAVTIKAGKLHRDEVLRISKKIIKYSILPSGMKEEAVRWLAQADADIKAARKNLDIRIYYLSVQMSHQATEKALKALFIEKEHKMPEKTHDLIKLARKVNLPELHFESLYSLNPEWIQTRYPDALSKIPSESYGKKDAEIKLAQAREVIQWIKEQRKK